MDIRDSNSETPQLVQWDSPTFIEPLQAIPQWDKYIEAVRIVEHSPIEGSGNFGFQTQKQQTFQLSNVNGLVVIEDSYIRQDILLATGTTACIVAGTDGLYYRKTLRTSNGIIIENKLNSNEVDTAFNVLERTPQNLYTNWDTGIQGLGSNLSVVTGNAGQVVLTPTAQTLNSKLNFSFGKFNKVIHSCVLGPVDVQVEFANDKVALMSSPGSSSPQIQCNNARMIAKYIDLSPEYREKLRHMEILYNFEAYAYTTVLWSGTNQQYAMRVAAKKCNWVLKKYHVQGDLNRCPTSNCNPYLKKFVYPDTGATNYQSVLQYAGMNIPQYPSKYDTELYRLTMDALKLSKYNDAGNIMTGAQYVISAGTGVQTDSACATYTGVGQHLVLIDLAKNGLNTGINLTENPLIVQEVFNANAPYDGAGNASTLYMDLIVGYSVVARVNGYQSISIATV
jgi:hypothetical protein